MDAVRHGHSRRANRSRLCQCLQHISGAPPALHRRRRFFRCVLHQRRKEPAERANGFNWAQSDFFPFVPFSPLLTSSPPPNRPRFQFLPYNYRHRCDFTPQGRNVEYLTAGIWNLPFVPPVDYPPTRGPCRILLVVTTQSSLDFFPGDSPRFGRLPTAKTFASRRYSNTRELRLHP